MCKQVTKQSLAHLSSVVGFMQWCVVGWDQLLATAGRQHQWLTAIKWTLWCLRPAITQTMSEYIINYLTDVT